MQSLCNESGGYKCQDVYYDFLKEVNPEIPVHYEGAISSKRWAYDVVSRMYGTPTLMRKILKGTARDKYKGKPFFQFYKRKLDIKTPLQYFVVLQRS